MKLIQYYSISFFVIIIACTNSQSNCKKISLNIPDSLDIDYILHKAQVKELNLPNLEMGSDSFEIRIWKQTEPWNINEIIIIKQEAKKGWMEGYYYRYWNKDAMGEFLEGAGNKDYADGLSTNSPEVYSLIDSVYVKKVFPKSGWDNFLIDLKNEKFYELPTQSKIPNFKIRMDDGVVWKVEITTSSKYKYLKYQSPEIYADKFWQCKQMERIGRIVNAEFPIFIPVDIDSLIKKNPAKRSM